MTEIALQGQVVPAVTQPGDPRSELLARLTAAWLTRQESPHTRVAYERDLRDWLAWCASREVHPLTARMSDVDDWIAAQRETPGRRGGSAPKYPDEAIAAAYVRWKAGKAPGGVPVSKAALAREIGMFPNALASRFRKLERDLTAGTPQGASKRSIARRVYAVRSWYKYLIRNTRSDPVPLIAYNPADTDATPKVKKGDSPTRALSRAEADRLIAVADADSPRSSAIIRLMLTNADRRSSVVAIDIPDLGWDQGHRTVTRRIKEGRTVRDPIPPPTARAIDAYLDWRGNPQDGPLFVASTGNRLSDQHLYDLVPRLAREADIPDPEEVTPHGLRATAITETIVATGDMSLAQDLAHHQHMDTTMIYNKVRGDLDRHAAYVLATRYGAKDASG
jgi:integrase/recombinase XerD